MKVKPTLLPIDECEEWIWEILDYTKDSSFEYITDEGKDFLIFNTNDFKCRFKGIIQDKKDYWNEIGTVQYPQLLSQLWFYKSPLTNKNGSLVTTYTFDEASIEYSSLIVHSNLQCGCNI